MQDNYWPRIFILQSFNGNTIVIQWSFDSHTIVYPVKLLALCNPLPKECLWQKWCKAITQGGQYFIESFNGHLLCVIKQQLLSS